MKSELKVFALVVITTIILINAYGLIYNNTISYNNIIEDNSTANYVVIEEKKEDNVNVQDIVEEEKEEEPVIVYDGLTIDDLSSKINKSLNSTISGMGYLIASKSLEMGVDPYMATAIMLHETGCKWNCSYLVNTCNNVGGQKGSGCGSYSYFNTLEEGIIEFISNLKRNYIDYGLTTPETINPKYAEDPNWSVNVNRYIEQIKAQ